jgi:hypothetical protein
MVTSGIPPDWLGEPAAVVLRDLDAGVPVRGVSVIAMLIGFENGLCLGLVDTDQLTRPLAPLVDDLDPGSDARLDPEEGLGSGGGNFIPRPLTGPGLLVRVAEILQEDLAETKQAWGQARPPCPYHPHPAAPVLRDGEAWWICRHLDEALYRIGRGEVPKHLQPVTHWPSHNSNRKAKRQKKRTHGEGWAR